MSHLQECQLLLEPMLPAQDWCICQQLRACEQRVLDAAREAVAGLKRHVEFPGAPVNYIHPDFFLAAIDALREKP